MSEKQFYITDGSCWNFFERIFHMAWKNIHFFLLLPLLLLLFSATFHLLFLRIASFGCRFVTFAAVDHFLPMIVLMTFGWILLFYVLRFCLARAQLRFSCLFSWFKHNFERFRLLGSFVGNYVLLFECLMFFRRFFFCSILKTRK